MKLKDFYSRRQFSNELKHTQAITDSLIYKILYSKRLLADHVEALEQCLVDFHDVTIGAADHTDSKAPQTKSSSTYGEIFTACNTCVLLGSTLLEHFITPKALRWTLLPSIVVTGGFSVAYVVKSVFHFRNKFVERELDQLIRTIDEFGNCIRRNMTYFNEILIMKQQELIESRQIERAWDCITNAKEVTEILYDATRKLEAHYPLPKKYGEHYCPIEELRDCDYFKNNVTDYSPKHIKDFHNIFAYVQSQFLMRLALTISTKPSIGQLNLELIKINSLIHQIVQEEEHHFKNLAIELYKKKDIAADTLHNSKAMQNRSGPVAVLQDSSLKLSARMVAVAGECQALDIALQRLTEAEAEHKDNANQLVEVANNMRSIESVLSVCFDDFQRLMLVYNKFLSSKLEHKDNKSEKDYHIEQSETTDDESFLRVEISQSGDQTQRADDFYAYLYDEEQAKPEQLAADGDKKRKPSYESEILNFEKRITKGKFRPVLKQLKDRIDPIRHEMLEKERQVLAAKGINVDELFGKGDDDAETAPRDISSEESDDSAELEFEKRTKKLKERDNFAEMRSFLAQKQALNIFNVDTPIQAANKVAVEEILGDEDILESEC